METIPTSFIHVVLFECSHCRRPIVLAITNTVRNVEDIDGRIYPLTCPCGWSGQSLGIEAKKHWVEPWASELLTGDNSATSKSLPAGDSQEN
jgi:hypothetical protein